MMVCMRTRVCVRVGGLDMMDWHDSKAMGSTRTMHDTHEKRKHSPVSCCSLSGGGIDMDIGRS